MKKEKNVSCYDNALRTSFNIIKAKNRISNEDFTPEECSALYLNMVTLLLNEIMFNTAIIADHYKINDIKKGGEN